MLKTKENAKADLKRDRKINLNMWLLNVASVN